jgi:hypothetical protein
VTNNNRKRLLVSMIFMLFALDSIAGTETGGGGDVVILPNDSVVLADPFIDLNAEQPNNMPPMRSLNPRIVKTIESYYKASQHIVSFLAAKEKSEINQQIKKLMIRKNDLRFYGVRSEIELNQFCAPGGRKKYSLPTGAKVEQVACTTGSETFIVEPTFIKLSIRDQSLLLIHERLTTLRDTYGGKNYSAVARFTNGLNTYLSLYSEQSKNIFRRLSPDEQKWLTEFYIAAEELELRNSEVTPDSFQWVAAHYGGGLVHTESRVNSTAVIGLSFIIGKDTEILAHAQLKRGKGAMLSHITKGVIGENVFIDQSVLYGKFKLDENVSINQSILTGNITLGRAVRILNSELGSLMSDDNSIGDNSIVESSQIYTPISSESNLRIEKSRIRVLEKKWEYSTRPIKISLSTDQILKNGYIDYESLQTYPKGFLVAPISTTWKQPLEYTELKYNHINVSSYKEISLVNQNGVLIDVSTDAKVDRRGVFDSTKDIVVTEVRFNINVKQSTSSLESKNAYTVFEGKLLPAGQNKYFDLAAERNIDRALLKLLEPRLMDLGFRIVRKHYADKWQVLIPLEQVVHSF